MRNYNAVMSWGENFYHERNPFLCGLMIQEITRYLHDLSILTDNGEDSLMTAIHVYNYALQQGLSSQCPDLESVIDLVGEHDVFIGKRPVEHEKCAKLFELAIGIPLHEVTSTSHIKIKAAPDPQALVQYLPKPSKPRRHLEFFSKAVQVSRDPNIKRSKMNSGTAHRAYFEPVALLDVLVSSEHSSTKQHKKPVLTPLESLALFKNIMIGDAIPLMFDVQAIMMRCRTYFDMFQDALKRGSTTTYKDHQTRQLGLFLIIKGSSSDIPQEIWDGLVKIIQRHGKSELKMAEARVGTGNNQVNPLDGRAINDFEEKHPTTKARDIRKGKLKLSDVISLD